MAYRQVLGDLAGRNEIGEWLEVMAEIDVLEGRHAQATTLFAAAHECRFDSHCRLRPEGLAHVVNRLEDLGAALGKHDFSAAWNVARRDGWAVPAAQVAGSPAERMPAALEPWRRELAIGQDHASPTLSFRPNQHNSAAIDARRRCVWTSGLAGLVRYDTASGEATRLSMVDGLNANWILSTHVNAITGDVWAGSQLGVNRLRPDGLWESHDHASGVPFINVIDPRFTDPRSGATWFWLGRGRVGTFTPNKGWWWRDLPPPLDASSIALVIALDPVSGALWFGTEFGAIRMDGLPHPTVYTAFADPTTGDVWFATVDGLGRLGPDGHWQVYRVDPRPPNPEIRSAGASLRELRHQQVRILPVGHGRMVRMPGFQIRQPGRRFAHDNSQYGHGGVPADVLTRLLDPR